MRDSFKQVRVFTIHKRFYNSYSIIELFGYCKGGTSTFDMGNSFN